MHFGRTLLVAFSLAASTAALLASLLGGCTTTPVPDSTGHLTVWITDKPFPFPFIDQATVTITRVDVRVNEGSETDESAASQPASETDEGSWVVLFEEPQGRSFNLLDLQNGRFDALAEADLPSGRYTQVRLVVSRGEVHLRDGREFVLEVPSGEQTGIKLRCDFEVRADDETELLVDVNLSRAFTPIPGGVITEPDQISEFRFSPSLAMRVIPLDEAGSIAGTVKDGNGFPIPAVCVTAYNDVGEVTSASTEVDGRFVLSGLPAGVYQVEFSTDGYEENRLEQVSVSAEQTSEVGDWVMQEAASKSLAAKALLQASADGLENLALNAAVTLHGPFFSTQYYTGGPPSDPQTVVDGVFLPRRTGWDRSTIWWVVVGSFQNGQYMTVDLGEACTIESFVVQTNSPEAYVLSYWDVQEQTWKVAWNVPTGGYSAYGMETRPNPQDNSARYALAAPIVTDRLKLTGAALTGVHTYSVSEIQAFGRPANSPPVAVAGGLYVSAATGWDGARVKLDGSGSTDPDADPLTYSWTVGGKQIGTDASSEWVFPIGETAVSLTVTDPRGASATSETTVTVTVLATSIDIKPGDPGNRVNLGGNGDLLVAFLTDPQFDAARINPATVSFPGYPFGGFVRMRGSTSPRAMAVLEDVDLDGDLDLLVHLGSDVLPIETTDTVCELGALTHEGLLVRGSDRITVFVPNRNK